MKIVCIGDSLTYGFGVSKEHSWIEILKKELHMEFINKGINGDTTSGMLSRAYQDVILDYPDKMMIMGGTNDFLKDIEEKLVLKNIIEILNEAQQHEIEPIVGIEIPVEPIMASKIWFKDVDYCAVNQKIKNYRYEIINHCNKKGYKYVDFYENFIENLHKNPYCQYYVDGIHPTYEGHKIMAEVFKKVLKDFI